MAASGLRWLAVALLLAAGAIHLVYGAYYVRGAPTVGGYGNPVSSGDMGLSLIFYGMGAIYLVGAFLLAVNVRPRLFQSLALVYALILLAAWAIAGARDNVAYLDKVIEVVLVVSLVVLITRKAVKIKPPVIQSTIQQ